MTSILYWGDFMEMSRFDNAECIITVRISKAEYEALEHCVDNLNFDRYRLRNKVTISKLVRQCIRYCLFRASEIPCIMSE